MYEHNENCDKCLGSMLQNTIMELENTLERFNSRVEEAEERISQGTGEAVELTQSEQLKGGKNEKSADDLWDLWENISQLTFTLLYRFPKEEREKWVEILLE